MERLHKNKRILDKKTESLKKKGGWAGKKKQLGDGWNKHRWEEVINDLANVDVNGSTWGETHRLKKGLTRQTRWSRRISIHIGIWEHHLEKVWNQHLTSKQLEYHNSKQNKGLACKISRNKHMIEIPSEVFVVGPTRAQVYSTTMYKAVHMTYEVSPSRHSQGLFKTQRDHCKIDRE